MCFEKYQWIDATLLLAQSSTATKESFAKQTPSGGRSRRGFSLVELMVVNHDDGTSASAGIDLSNNDDYVRQTVYYWYDAVDRMTAMADYGSGDTTAGAGSWKYAAVPSRPGTAPASSSSTSLVTKYSYNTLTGAREISTDPSGMQSKTVVDDLGRTIYSISNYNNFNDSTEANTGDATDKSRDQVTKFIYNGAGQLKELVALDANADGSLSDNQSTKYLFEHAVNASLVTNEIYPDSSDTASSGTDQIKFEYNLTGAKTKSTDQRGTVIEYAFTNERRLELEKVTTLGSGVDSLVQSKKMSYDSLARLEKHTSFSASNGTGTIRNELQYAYDGLMNVTTIYQSHEGAVNTSTSPKVVFGYDTTLSGGGSADDYAYGHRRNQVTYPDGRVVFYDFDTANPDYPFSRLSKVRRIRETNSSGTILAEYSYSGEGRLAISDLQEPDVKLDYFQGTSGTYAGFDRFGRTKDLYWKGYGSTANVDRFKYSYDYAGNRTSTDIDSAIYASNNKDEVYTYDGAHRLKNFDEGTLSGASITGTPVQEQDWSLDALGNWSNYVKKASGTTSLNQNRTVNPTNEITNITETTGPSWITPAYDAAGSMTTIPQPNSLTAGYTATFDAWHRLVKLANGATTVAEYEYDATKQRIVKSIYASGTLDHREHFYYNDNWQATEIRKEVSGTEDVDPLSQYVWHPYYVDALLLRDYDSDTDGTSVRYYYTHDTIFNVVSILNASGTVLERYGYTPYGQGEVLDANFSADSDGLSDMANDVTFTGQRFDAESGLMLYRHRFYHPVIGTFCSKDPIGYEGSKWNLFEYVHSRSLVLVDPFGLVDLTNPYQQVYSDETTTIVEYDPTGFSGGGLSPTQGFTGIGKRGRRTSTGSVGLAPARTPGGYGNYCGPTRAAACMKGPGGISIPRPGQPAPIDALDAACMAHDCCLADTPAVIRECFKPVCNPAICTAMAAFSCAATYKDPQKLYDCQYMKWKAMVLFCPGPTPPSSTL